MKSNYSTDFLNALHKYIRSYVCDMQNLALRLKLQWPSPYISMEEKNYWKHPDIFQLIFFILFKNENWIIK